MSGLGLLFVCLSTYLINHVHRDISAHKLVETEPTSVFITLLSHKSLIKSVPVDIVYMNHCRVFEIKILLYCTHYGYQDFKLGIQM